MPVLRLSLFVPVLWLAGCPSAIPERPVEPAVNECGGSAPLTQEVGGDCCLNGTWTCQGVDEVVCRSADGGDGGNRCGGCAELEAPECGPCREAVCDGPGALVCEPDHTNSPCGDGSCGRLACNASTGDWVCNPPTETPGDSCGVCSAGIFACVDGDVVCEQPGLPGGEIIPGRTPCGFCDAGVWQCTQDGLTCSATAMDKEEADATCACGEAVCAEGQRTFECSDTLESCGPCRGMQCDLDQCPADRTGDTCLDCGTLVCDGEAPSDVWICAANAQLETACGVCGAGSYVCTEQGVVCAQPDGFEGDEVPGETRCGYCGTGVWQCGESGPECVGATSQADADASCQCGPAQCADGDRFECAVVPHDCGPCQGLVCDPDACLDDRAGAPCEDCGSIACAGDAPDDAFVCEPHPDIDEECGECENRTGAWLCDPQLGMVCDGGTNACGGCAFLDGERYGECGCGGHLDCDGLDSLVCVEEQQNSCGGCDLELDARLQEPSCGVCGLGELICDGPDALTCDNERLGINTCGGCGELAEQPGTPCGACARWTCSDGDLVCEELDRDTCGLCPDRELEPTEPCGLCNQGVVTCEDNELYCDESEVQMPGDACEGGYLTCVENELVCEPAPDGWTPIPAGSYCMGTPPDRACRNQEWEDDLPYFDSEQPTPTVVTHPILAMTHELTRAQWREYDPDAVFSQCVCDGEGCEDACPADFVTWFQVLDYANWRSRTEGLTECYPSEVAGWAQAAPAPSSTGAAIDAVISTLDLDCDGYRLPTEAEWEYAARAGATTRSPVPGELEVCGTSSAPEPILDPVAWWSGTAAGRLAHPTGTLNANAWGLHDVLGNVSEMVMAQQYAFDHPSVPVFDRVWRTRLGNSRNVFVRGGGSNSFSWTVGLAAKRAVSASVPYERVGFRLVRTIPTPEAMREARYWSVPTCP